VGRNLAYVCCSGKQYLGKLLRNICHIYELKQEGYVFKNLAVESKSASWPEAEHERCSGRGQGRSALLSVPGKPALCGSPAWARAPQSQGQGGSG